MKMVTLEGFLARLYSDPAAVEQFLQSRRAFAVAAGLPERHLADVLVIDPAALRFAAWSFERKRRAHGHGHGAE